MLALNGWAETKATGAGREGVGGEAGEVAPWLRSLTALAEDPHPQSGSPPSITPVSGIQCVYICK